MIVDYSMLISVTSYYIIMSTLMTQIDRVVISPTFQLTPISTASYSTMTRH